MTDDLVLTYAEVGFLLATRPDAMRDIRAQLNLPADDDERDVRAGVSSLLARNLCRAETAGVVPGVELTAVIGALSGCRVRVSAVGWTGPTVMAWHLFGGPDAAVVLVPEAYGRFSVTLIDPAAPLETVAVRMLDAVVGEPESGLVVRIHRSTETAGIAIAVDAHRTWYVSNAADTPDRGVPVPREQAVAQLAELVGATLISGPA